jgi:hypothetical protein
LVHDNGGVRVNTTVGRRRTRNVVGSHIDKSKENRTVIKSKKCCKGGR